MTTTTVTLPLDGDFEQMSQAAGHLNRAQCVRLATDLLEFVSVPHKIWQPDDIDSLFTEQPGVDGRPVFIYGDRSYTRREKDLIVEQAQDTHYWRNLTDCTDGDWSLVDHAIADAVAEIRKAEDVGRDL